MTDIIPYSELETVFLDVGNTLITVDFELVAEHLRRLGIRATPAAVRRAEAAARPIVSAAAGQLAAPAALELFAIHLQATLHNLPAACGVGGDADELVTGLAMSLRAMPTQRLWSERIPGTRAALAGLRELGLKLIAVSNSDGTAEASLTEAGLRQFIDEVPDSHLLGIEKPDPRIFAHALAAANADPKTTLHVGDMYHIDVCGARAAGVHAVLVDPYGDWPDVDCPRIIDVAELVKRIGATR